jgi:hypothetical protein
VVTATGVPGGRAMRALDSVVLEDAVATQDTVTQLIAAIRRVSREVPGAAAVIAQRCRAHDYDSTAKPAIAWDDQAAREALVSALVADASVVLDELAAAELDEKAGQALALLALIAGQDVEPAEGSDGTDGRWRIARKVAADRVISTAGPDSRHVHKSRHQRQDGYKAHLAVEPGTGLFTGGKLTRASGEATTRPWSGWSCWAARTAGLQSWVTPPTAPRLPAPRWLLPGIPPPSGRGRCARR